MAEASKLQMTYIGGPTLLIEFGGLRLLTDPTFDAAGSDRTTGPVTLHKTMGPALDGAALGRIDVVLLSHDHHYDNLDDAGRALLPNAGQVLTTPEGEHRLGGNARGLKAWEQVDIPAPDGRTLRVTATPGRHGPADGDRGPVIGFVLQFTDDPELILYLSGDTVWYEGTEEIVRRFPGIRLAVLFLGAARISIVPSHLTLTANEAVQFARALPAAAIVPVHFEGWGHFSESREEVVQAFAEAGLQNRLYWLKAGESTPLPASQPTPSLF
jgi:L-ascorbate metabolism protein UlaG (beta-lactamase superfamily)